MREGYGRCLVITMCRSVPQVLEYIDLGVTPGVGKQTVGLEGISQPIQTAFPFGSSQESTVHVCLIRNATEYS